MDAINYRFFTRVGVGIIVGIFLLAPLYRLWKRWKRRCPHCGSMRVERIPTREVPPRAHDERDVVCEMDRTCLNRACAFYMIREVEKAERKKISRLRYFWEKIIS